MSISASDVVPFTQARANLSELAGPLFGLIDGLALTGTETARWVYAAPGWVAHHNTDSWAYSELARGPPRRQPRHGSVDVFGEQVRRGEKVGGAEPVVLACRETDPKVEPSRTGNLLLE